MKKWTLVLATISLSLMSCGDKYEETLDVVEPKTEEPAPVVCNYTEATVSTTASSSVFEYGEWLPETAESNTVTFTQVRSVIENITDTTTSTTVYAPSNNACDIKADVIIVSNNTSQNETEESRVVSNTGYEAPVEEEEIVCEYVETSNVEVSNETINGSWTSWSPQSANSNVENINQTRSRNITTITLTTTTTSFTKSDASCEDKENVVETSSAESVEQQSQSRTIANPNYVAPVVVEEPQLLNGTHDVNFVLEGEMHAWDLYSTTQLVFEDGKAIESLGPNIPDPDISIKSWISVWTVANPGYFFAAGYASDDNVADHFSVELSSGNAIKVSAGAPYNTEKKKWTIKIENAKDDFDGVFTIKITPYDYMIISDDDCEYDTEEESEVYSNSSYSSDGWSDWTPTTGPTDQQFLDQTREIEKITYTNTRTKTHYVKNYYGCEDKEPTYTDLVTTSSISIETQTRQIENPNWIDPEEAYVYSTNKVRAIVTSVNTSTMIATGYIQDNNEYKTEDKTYGFEVEMAVNGTDQWVNATMDGDNWTIELTELGSLRTDANVYKDGEYIGAYRKWITFN